MKTAYYNAKVYTGTLPLCEAFTVEDGRFGMTGSNDEILSSLSDTDVRIDLNGSFVCAGFNDSHMHLLSFGKSLHSAQLAAHTDSLTGMLDYMRVYLKENPPREGQWVLGRGWNQDYFSDVHRMPNRHDLDSVSADVPILLTRACGHCCVVNTKALEMAGITAATEPPAGGDIGREDGVPDGRFFDNAIELIQSVLPAPGRPELREMLRTACQGVNRYGITSVQTDDYQVFAGVPWQMINEVYQELADSGELTARIYEQAQFTEIDALQDFVDKGNRTGTGSDLFRIGPIKLLGDGSLGSRTAYLSRPYDDAPDTCGFTLFSDEKMNNLISCAHGNGMQIAVHTIGDACLDQVLNAIDNALEKDPRADHRHGIVHCQITRSDQLERIQKLGLHVYAQSVFLDYDNHIVEKRAGKELASTSYSWKTLKEYGVSVSNGSDCPVELPDVMKGIECAVTRTSMDGTGPYLADQAFSVREALDSFTIKSAEASFEESTKGKIAPGFLADFTVLAQDPFTVEPKHLHEIKIIGCYLGGRLVWSGT